MSFIGRIYRINFPDGYFYIGNTKQQIEDRLLQHKKHWLKTIKDCDNMCVRYISKAPFDIYIRKYGWNNPEISLVIESNVYDKTELENIEYLVLRKYFYHPKNLNTVCKGEPRKDKRLKKDKRSLGVR